MKTNIHWIKVRRGSVLKKVELLTSIACYILCIGKKRKIYSSIWLIGRDLNHIYPLECDAGNFYVIKIIPVQLMVQMIIAFKNVDYITSGERITGCVDRVRESLQSKFTKQV